MIDKVLIANRGEIARRIMQTARYLGIRTVAIYSEADRQAPHVGEADESYCVGSATATESYLAIDNIIAVAKQSGADAVHPGYGFLAENAEFAQACNENNIIFIGPSVESISLMGNKRLAKVAVRHAGVPCIPGYDEPKQDEATLLAAARSIGFPVMIKASAGGGGRGMRLVVADTEFIEQLKLARSEARNSFANDEVILEKALSRPRHIEIQIVADQHGHVVHLGERDCSIQRRHQKVVEESPSPFMEESLRQLMGEAAIKVAKSCDYVGAGTIEFLVDEEQNYYFLEMNTRLQVEHPVTEMVYGVDLVEWQFKVAMKQPLPRRQADLLPTGHAIEVRLYAEDPDCHFTPQTGKLLRWQPAVSEFVRVDSGVETGSVISPFYDPMLAKIIAYGEDRDSACRSLLAGLERSVILGLTTNQSYLTHIIGHPAFRAGDVTTGFIQQYLTDISPGEVTDRHLRSATIAGLIYYLESSKQLGCNGELNGWSNGLPIPLEFSLQSGDLQYELSLVVNRRRQQLCSEAPIGISSSTVHIVCKCSGADVHLTTDVTNLVFDQSNLSFNVDGVNQDCQYELNNNTLYLKWDGTYFDFVDVTYDRAALAESAATGEIKAAMDGTIIDILVQTGSQVEIGQTVIVLEAMKMEHQLKSDANGIVTDIKGKVGDQVKIRQLLASVKPSVA